MTRDVMRDFAKQYACKWSFQNGALTLIPYTSFIPTPAAGIPVISVATGLIGVPEQTQGGIAKDQRRAVEFQPAHRRHHARFRPRGPDQGQRRWFVLRHAQ